MASEQIRIGDGFVSVADNPRIGLEFEARDKALQRQRQETDTYDYGTFASREEGITSEDVAAELDETVGSINLFDTYALTPDVMVSISCPNKLGPDPVRGILVEAFQFTLDSKWDHKVLGSVSDVATLRIPDTLLQDLGGLSIQQPVLERRTWGGTSPLSFNLHLKFQGQSDYYNEVYLNVIKLATLLIPRIVDSAAKMEGILSILAIPGPAPFGDSTATDLTKLLEKITSTPLAGLRANMGGDNVSVKVGNVAALDFCYVTKFTATFSKTMGSSPGYGPYPESADVVMTVQAMDTPYFVTQPEGKNFDNNANNVLMNSNRTNPSGAYRKIVSGTVENLKEFAEKYDTSARQGSDSMSDPDRFPQGGPH